MKAAPFATALAAITAVVYVLCALLALAAPGLFLALFETWVHGLDLARIAPDGMLVTPLRFIVGLVTVTLAAWVFGWAWAALYNLLVGQAEEVPT